MYTNGLLLIYYIVVVAFGLRDITDICKNERVRRSLALNNLSIGHVNHYSKDIMTIIIITSDYNFYTVHL